MVSESSVLNAVLIAAFAATESLYHAVERRMQGEGTIKPNRTQVDIRMGGRIRFAV